MGRVILKLKRIAKRETYTIGHLYINDKFFCDTLEDADRGLDDAMAEEYIKRKKIYGQTAIPTGIYRVDMSAYSPKFGNRPWGIPYHGRIPRLLGVKGFDGILIHPLNSADESLGCIGVGKNKVKGKILESTNTFYDLMDKYLVPAHQRGDDIWIVIT